MLDGVNHLLHLPGVSDNAQVLAASAVAALREWANPFAAAPASYEVFRSGRCSRLSIWAGPFDSRE